MNRLHDLNSKINRMQSFLAQVIEDINPELSDKRKIKSSEFFKELLEISDDKNRTADAESVLNEHVLNILEFGEILGSLKQMISTKIEKNKVVNINKKRFLEID